MGLNRFQIISGCSWLALKIRPSLSYTPHVSPFSFKGTLLFQLLHVPKRLSKEGNTRRPLIFSTQHKTLSFGDLDLKLRTAKSAYKISARRDSHSVQCWLSHCCPQSFLLAAFPKVTSHPATRNPPPPPSTKHSSAAPHPTAGASAIPLSLTLAASHSFLHKIFCSSCSPWPSKQSWE